MPILQPPPLRPRSGARRFWMAMGVFAGLALVCCALLHVEEDWRGTREWTAAQRELQGQGESLDHRHFLVPPVPDGQNLAMAPLFARELHYEVNAKTHTYTFGPDSRRPKDLADLPYGEPHHANLKIASYELARPPDLAGYQDFYRHRDAFPRPGQPGTPAADVLLALTRYAPVLDELARAAAERPSSRFPLDWNRQEFWGISLAHYELERSLVRTLCLRATAELALANRDDALRDLELALRLCRDVGREHLLIGSLVEITSLQMVLNAVWQGLAARQWTADQLTRLQTNLQEFDVLGDFADAMRMERAMTIYNFDYLKRTHDIGLFTVDGAEHHDDAYTKANKIVGWFVPGGWFDANKAMVSRFEQDYSVATVDVKNHRVFPARTAGAEPAWRAMRGSLRLALSRIVLSVLQSITPRYARVQTALDQAVTACALERFALAHGAYPARLDELVPALLASVPPDVIDGAPMRYRLTPDGRYRLHEVGWNGQDEDGGIEWDGNALRLDPKRGDWVWQYVELTNPTQGK